MRNFNPRSPDGERHGVRESDRQGAQISIHAPRMGSDAVVEYADKKHFNFNPRSPDGERRLTHRMQAAHFEFQSTLPGWGATIRFQRGVPQIVISIHAPRMGSDENA